MRNIYLTIAFVFIFLKIQAQTNCDNISIDTFSGQSCDLTFTNSDPLNTVKQVECNGLTGAISGSADIWMQKLSPVAGGSAAAAGYYGTGSFDFSPGAVNVSTVSITYDGADANTDPDNPNLTGPVLGDFTAKTIQFLATIDDISAGRYIRFTVNAWDALGRKSTATVTITGPQVQINNLNYNLGVLTGTADLTDIRAIQFIQESSQNGMDNAISQLSAICPGSPPLPVTLVDFSATSQEANVSINWVTTNEMNADRFEIEKSYDSRAFIKLGEIKAQGELKKATEYHFQYSGALDRNTYFRLKMIDHDGSFAYSRIISVKSKIDTLSAVTIFPTFFSENLSLSIPDTYRSNEPVNLQITDMKGNVVVSRSYRLSEDKEIKVENLARLPSGTYLVQILSGLEKQTSRVIKL